MQINFEKKKFQFSYIMRRNFFPDLIYNYMYGYFLIISVSSNNFINILYFDFVWMIRMMMMISAGWDLRV